MGRLYDLGRGFVAVYCLITCSTVILLSFFLVYLPAILIHKNWERHLQTVVQRLWVYLLLGVTAHVADSTLIVSVPELQDDLTDEQRLRLVQMLSQGFCFPKQKDVGTVFDSREIIISNHQLYLDWIYIWSFMSMLGRAGAVKIILKRSLMNIPFIGLGMRLLNFIFLHRNWEKDRQRFGVRLNRLVHGIFPFSLVIFPEGTTFCKRAIVKSKAFGVAHKLKVPKHTLIPRVTGMQFALATLGEHISGIMDLTLGYTGTKPDEDPEVTFGLKSLFFQGRAPPQIHMHVRFHPIDKIPFQDHEAFSQWMYERFQEKDRLLDIFYRQGRFPGTSSKPVPVAPASAIFWIFLATGLATFILWTLIGAAIAWCSFR